MQLSGIHHLTAVTADVRSNYRFYTGTLGMRLVKRTVNQDDTSAYHLFYADAVGHPGTDITFFDWPSPPERRGSNSVVCTGLRVQGEAALEWWEERLQSLGVKHEGVMMLDGRATLPFEDPEGQRLSLVDDRGTGDPPHPWDRSPVPAQYQVRGLGPIVMSVPRLGPTHEVLTAILRFRHKGEYQSPGPESHPVHVYEMGQGGPSAELHVAEEPRLSKAGPGAGGVHHVAFRTPNEEQYHTWARELSGLGVRHSGEIDRYYFRSLYFREPGGILFEIASDGPGFALDENPDTLGEAVSLPPFLEPRRAQILANLKPIE